MQAILFAALCVTRLPAQPPAPTNPLAFLHVLIGEWAPDAVPDSVLRRRPQLRNFVTHSYEWTVGHNAIRLREGYARGRPQESELDGLIYWDPSSQRVRFTAVAGHSDSAGRLFEGEYVRLADGRIERTYDVHYRTKYDTPGEELGGTRRRYREVYSVDDRGAATATLDWWRDGRWAPYALGRHAYKRVARQ
jgi:hypothetical protein